MYHTRKAVGITVAATMWPKPIYFPHIFKAELPLEGIFFALNFLPWEFLLVKKLEIEKTKTIFIISVLRFVYLVVLVFWISNFFTNKNSQGRKLSAGKIPSSGNSAFKANVSQENQVLCHVLRDHSYIT